MNEYEAEVRSGLHDGGDDLCDSGRPERAVAERIGRRRFGPRRRALSLLAAVAIATAVLAACGSQPTADVIPHQVSCEANVSAFGVGVALALAGPGGLIGGVTWAATFYAGGTAADTCRDTFKFHVTCAQYKVVAQIPTSSGLEFYFTPPCAFSGGGFGGGGGGSW